MAKPEIINPVEIKQGTRQNLIIRWQDEHESSYESRYLREHCRCAGCVDEWTGQKRAAENEIPANVHPLEVQGVGRYGLRIQWSDGHRTGIYTFQYLKEICPCDLC